MPTPAERDVRQLLVHRHQRVRMRTQVKNQLQAIALNQGLQKKRKLWTQAGRAALKGLPLLPFAAQRRQQLLGTLDRLEREIGELDRQVAEQAEQRPEAVRLMSHPGVGPNTALGFVLTIGEVSRFRRARQVASYLGLIPREHSSGGKQRLGHISKQGSAFMRFLLVEAGQSAAKGDAQLGRLYRRLTVRAAAKPRWRASWRCGCTGCCAITGTMRSCVGPLCRGARVILSWKLDRPLEWAACLA